MMRTLLPLLILSLASLIVPQTFGQTTIEVTSVADSGAGSLREAITMLASSGDTIVFHDDLSGDTIRFDSGRIQITIPLTIDASALDDPIILSGDSLINSDRDRLFTIAAATEFKSLIFEFGAAANGSGSIGSDGGAIFTGTDLTIEDCVFRNNEAGNGSDGFGGGKAGAIRSGGPLTVRRCVFHNNTAGNGGQNLSGNGGNGGDAGAILCVDDLTIEDSTFYENTAGNGGAASGFNSGNGGDGGAIFCTGELLIERSTFYENEAGRGGGGNTGQGHGGHGGGVFSRIEPTTILNSTFFKNAAGDTFNVPSSNGGEGGAIRNTSDLILRNCTIIGNRGGEGGNGTGGDGGGVFGTDAALSNTVIAMNQVTDGGEGVDIWVTEPNLTSEGVNFIGDNGGSILAFPVGQPNADGNLVGDSATPLDPLLMPLSDNGGFTATMVPVSASDLVDPPNGDTMTSLLSDQRGLSRIEGVSLDIGSVEFNNNDLSDEEVAAAAAAAAAAQAALAAQQAASVQAALRAALLKKIKKLKTKFKAAKRKGQVAKAKSLKAKIKKLKKELAAV